MPRTKDSLATYRKKRDFEVTPEPAPTRPRKRTSRRGAFVVQKHDATRLHYDVRIEIDGAMMSWAVPKGPSYDPSVKRLAVETEDHPMAYNRFEGRIPDGEYGAGDVLIWDRGTYETVPPGQERAMRAKGHVHVRFFGKKLEGDWHFVRTRRGSSPQVPLQGGKAQWLMFKAKDELADPERDIVVERPESIVSGQRAHRGPRRTTGKSIDELLAKIGEVEKATLVKGIDDPKQFRFEIKYDGYRILAVKAGDVVRLVSRRGNDWTTHFQEVADAVAKLPVREAVLDGEVCALDEEGRPSFNLLQNWLGVSRSKKSKLSYPVFDLLWVDGRDLRELPLEERRELLEPLIGKKKGLIALSASLEGSLDELLQLACDRGLEGLIAKRKGSLYRAGRSRDWLKLKCSKRQEFALLGYRPLTRTKNVIGSLLLGIVDDEGAFHFAGKVGTGFDDATRKSVAKKLDAHAIDEPPCKGAPRIRDAHWSAPKLVGEVAFTEWTPDGKVRHPSFLGLRADKKPKDCTRENPLPKSVTKTSARAAAKVARAEGPKLSNPDKVLYPREGITKREILEYYTDVAEVMLPHLEGRPLALQRWPNGVDGMMFFQQNAPEKLPDFVRVIPNASRRHVVVENLETLQWLANLAALTLHQWSAHAPPEAKTKAQIAAAIDRPDYVIFDLDPGDGTWAHLIEVADAVHRLLDELELESFVKTSGKRGIHVLAAIERTHTHQQATAFAEKIATAVARVLPKIATVERMKNKRGGRLYVDFLQNGKGKTIVAPYTLRAIDRATVSTPVKWSEVSTKLDPTRFTLRTVRKRIDKLGDLFAGVLEGTATLPR